MTWCCLFTSLPKRGVSYYCVQLNFALKAHEWGMDDAKCVFFRSSYNSGTVRTRRMHLSSWADQCVVGVNNGCPSWRKRKWPNRLNWRCFPCMQHVRRLFTSSFEPTLRAHLCDLSGFTRCVFQIIDKIQVYTSSSTKRHYSKIVTKSIWFHTLISLSLITKVKNNRSFMGGEKLQRPWLCFGW